MVSIKILIIGYVWPEPASSAAGSHMLSLVNCFRAQNWPVYFASPAAQTIRQCNPGDYGVQTLSIAVNDSGFDALLMKLQPDVVVFDRFMTEEQFSWRVRNCLPEALRILNTEDFHSLRFARHQAIKQNRIFTLQDLNHDQAYREVAAILRSDLTLMISEYETDLLIRHFKVDAQYLHILPFMLDVEKIRAHQENSQHHWPFVQRKHFMFIGNFRHAPNQDAVLWLHRRIWPLIRKKLPQTQLHICGAYPSPAIMALNNPGSGFNVLGPIDCVASAMEQARVNLAPLRFGAGIKGKLADAMYYGTPGVTTDIGAEGMTDPAVPWPGFIASTAEDFANKAVQLYSDSDIWQQAQQNGYKLAAKRYNARVHSNRLIQKIYDIRQHLQQNRRGNFMGQMLWHHQLRSTEFMSRWIELKNSQPANV